jgi:hypothetical protein
MEGCVLMTTPKTEPAFDWAEQKAVALLPCSRPYCKPNHHLEGCFASLREPVAEALRLVRANALEEAAKVADEKFAAPGWNGHIKNAGLMIAGAIRALKESR